jgi:hypothetical protein
MKRNVITLSFFVTLALIFGFTGCPGPEKGFPCTLTYDANGGSGTVPGGQTVKEDTTVIVADPGNLNYPGKTFSGWNKYKAGYGESYAPGDRIIMNYDYTLYAQWSTNQYTVKYDANGGSGTVPASKTVNEGTSVLVSGQGSLGYLGKAFGGWNTASDGSGTSYAADVNVKVIESITLYAQWLTMQYTVTYHINDGTGTVPEPQSVDGGDSVTVADGNGYFFGGWNTNSSGTGTTYEAGSFFIPTGNSANITLYAMWIAPMIRTGDAYKDVTSNGTVRIHLMTDARYIFSGTEEYRLYRSETRNGTYSIVATVSPDQLVLEDTTVDWMTTGDSPYYKVAAVSGGTEAMSTNGVKIYKLRPNVYVRYSNYMGGYWGVRLSYGDGYLEWTEYANPSTIYELVLSPTRSPPPPGNYTLYTSTASSSVAISLFWTSRGPLTIRASHEYTINLPGGYLGIMGSSFDKSNWTFF